MKKYISAILLFASFTICSCSDDGPRGVVFKKAEFGERWPFSVDQIDVYCAGVEKNEIYFQSGEKIYALNGSAQTAAETQKSGQTFNTFKEVWLDDPKYPGSKVAMPPEFITKATENCEKQ